MNTNVEHILLIVTAFFAIAGFLTSHAYIWIKHIIPKIKDKKVKKELIKIDNWLEDANKDIDAMAGLDVAAKQQLKQWNQIKAQQAKGKLNHGK